MFSEVLNKAMIFIKNDIQYKIRKVVDIVYDDDRKDKLSHVLGEFEVIQLIRRDKCPTTKILLNDDFIGKDIESGIICLIQSSRFSHNVGGQIEEGLGYQVFELSSLQLKEYIPFN